MKHRDRWMQRIRCGLAASLLLAASTVSAVDWTDWKVAQKKSRALDQASMNRAWELIEEAAQLVAQDKLREGADKALEAILIHPAEPAAHRLRARALEAYGQRHKAIHHWIAAAHHSPPDRRQEAMSESLRVLAAMYKYERLIPCPVRGNYLVRESGCY